MRHKHEASDDRYGDLRDRLTSRRLSADTTVIEEVAGLTPVSGTAAERSREKRRLTNAVKAGLREVNISLSLLSHQVGAQLDLRDVDFDCLDFISRYGPLNPSELARSTGLHPATLTGILDRLERGGWIARERDPDDRRAVRLRVLRDRYGEVIRLLSGMNSSMDEICSEYDDDQLQLLADFLARVAAAGRTATDQLSG